MSEIRICKYCGMELLEDVPHGLRDCHLHAVSRIVELEAENEKIDYFFKKLRMYCIFAHWDNPNTEAEFYKVDAEIREYLSEYKTCIDQPTANLPLTMP